MFIDTHCHLNFKAFDKDWPEMVEEAKAAGVEKIIVVGADIDSSRRAVELAEKTDGLYATVGLHPHHAQTEPKMAELKKLAKNKKVVAVGECGLDYYIYQKTKYGKVKITEAVKNQQKRVFGLQIQLAKELGLPILIHNRQAGNDVLDVLDHFCKVDGKYPLGVLHCISGKVKDLKRVLALGFYTGVDGNVTYSQEVQGLVKEIPLERLVLETDSPYLSPVPYRGLRNKPINVKIVAEFIAKLKGVSLDKIETLTSKNTQTLFNI